MPPKTERSISLPTNKPPRIATRSRATAHTHPNPQHTSTPPPLAFIPAAATRWNGDSQPAMPSQSQDSEHQLSHEEPNTPRATVSSPPTTTTTSTSTSTTTPSTTTSSTPSSSSARPVPTRRDTRTNRRASQSSTTNTVSPGPSDPQPSEQPAEERARSTTPVSEVGEVAETHEARIPTRSHSADSSVAEPSEDPSHPGGRRKSTRLTASVADSVEGEAAPDMNVTRRRKGGRGLARANGGSVGRPKAVAEYDESDDSETEVTAPKLTREEKKARREALLQERFAELDTMQRQIEGGTHPSFTQELDDIEAKRKRKLQIAKTRLAYSKVSIDEFLLAAEKQAHDDFAFGRLALRRSMLEDVQRKITSLHNELIKLKFPKNPSEKALDEDGDYPNIRPFMISSLPQGLTEDEIEADLSLMQEIPIDDYREYSSHRHRRHRDRDRDREYDLYVDQEPDYEYEDDQHHHHYGYMPEPEPQPVYGDYEPDLYGREYEYGLLQELSRERPREMYYDPVTYDGDYYGASTSTAPYMHRGDSYASYNNDRESFVESSSEEISPTPAPPSHTFYPYYPPPDPRYAPSPLPPPPSQPLEASSSSSSIKRKYKHRSRDSERDKRQRYEEQSVGEQDGYHESGRPFYYVEDEDDRVRDEDHDHRYHQKHHNTHQMHRHSSSSMDRRPSWSESIKKKKKHRKDKFAVPVMVGSE